MRKSGFKKDATMQEILVLAYPGSGKTYLANHYKNVSDFEFQHYRYDYGEYKNLPLEQLKGRTEIRTIRPNWLSAFSKALDNEIKKREIVLVPFSISVLTILDAIASTNNVRIILAIQNKKSFDQIIKNFKKRKNSKEFIERRMNDFVKSHGIIAKSKWEKVYIDNGEFLFDALSQIGVRFKKGQGAKNYV